MGYGHATSHVPAYASALGGGSMSLPDRVRNVIAYHKLQLWRQRVYEPRLASFRQRHRLAAFEPQSVSKHSPSPPCHLRSTVVITGAEWGLIEPQPLPPAVKLVGPLRAGQDQEGSATAAALPEEVAAHLAAATKGVAVIAFPDDYRPPLRALLAIAEAVVDLKQSIVWRMPPADIARVRQVYLPLRHSSRVLTVSHVPLGALLAAPQVVSLITAGSMQCLYQGLYHGKPVMAVPLSRAQEDAVARLAALGAGQRLSRAELEGGAASFRISVAIERMSNVFSYTAAAQLLATQLRAARGEAAAAALLAVSRAAAGVAEAAAATGVEGVAATAAGGGAEGERLAAGAEAGKEGQCGAQEEEKAAPVTTHGSTAAAGAGGPGIGSSLERAAGWVDYVMALDEQGRQYLTDRSAACMGPLEAANVVAYGVVLGAGLISVGLVVLVVHVCTRMPPPPKPKKIMGSKRSKDE